MTREEAILHLDAVRATTDNGQMQRAIDMAIEALECVNSSAFRDGYAKGREDAMAEIKSKFDYCSRGLRREE